MSKWNLSTHDNGYESLEYEEESKQWIRDLIQKYEGERFTEVITESSHYQLSDERTKDIWRVYKLLWLRLATAMENGSIKEGTNLQKDVYGVILDIERELEKRMGI